MEPQLTPQQESVADNALNDLLNSEDRVAAIIGPAGTGKSFVASKLFDRLPCGYRVTFLAYTNKAVYNLEKLLAFNGLAAECTASTIHSFLKLSKEKIDPTTGKRKFIKSDSDYHEEAINPREHLLVVDEMGTVPNNEDSPIALELMQLDNPILCLGDIYQLPPPMEKVGALFSLLEGHTYELTEILRYKGGLLQAATHIRERINEVDALDVLYSSNHHDGEGLFHCQPLARRKLISEFVKREDYTSNPDSFRVLTWRKKTMDYWNSYLKTLIYGEDALSEKFLVGERIIAMESCTDRQTARTTHSTFNKKVKLMSASQEGTVTSVQKVESEVLSTSFAYYSLGVKTDQGTQVNLRVLFDFEELKRDKLLKSLASKRQWREYWELKDYFHDVKSAFSLNIDRCQGITLENAFMDVEDVIACREVYHRNRVAYTMLTRCKYQVFT